MTDLLARPDVAVRGDVGDGRYRLGDVVGRGRRSVVHTATDDRLRRTVAVRLFEDTVSPDDLVAAASVWAPGTARVFDAGVEDDGTGQRRAYLVREFVAGRSLQQLTDNVEFRPATVAGVAAAVATTLAALHREGVDHGSVHGGNVLVRDAVVTPMRRAGTDGSYLTDLDVVLTDLGLGRPRCESSTGEDVRALGRTVLATLTRRRVVGSRTARAALATLHHRGPLSPLEAGRRREWLDLLSALTDDRHAPGAVQAAAAFRALHRDAITG